MTYTDDLQGLFFLIDNAISGMEHVNILMRRQNGRYFADDILVSQIYIVRNVLSLRDAKLFMCQNVVCKMSLNIDWPGIRHSYTKPDSWM